MKLLLQVNSISPYSNTIFQCNNDYIQYIYSDIPFHRHNYFSFFVGNFNKIYFLVSSTVVRVQFNN